MDKKIKNNKKKFAILVDSCCDVPEEYLTDYPIYVIPLRINYKNASFKDRDSGQVAGIEKIKEQIENILPHCKINTRGQISPVLGVHAGPGLIGIAA
jgi:fatty acid-binding protein DegV